MVRYEEWIERAKSSLELAQARITKYLQYEVKTCTMTIDEKLAISHRAFEWLEAGDREGLIKSAPMPPPHLAKVAKEGNLKAFLDFASSKRKVVENYKFVRDECY